jgi:hypothetical protein
MRVFGISYVMGGADIMLLAMYAFRFAFMGTTPSYRHLVDVALLGICRKTQKGYYLREGPSNGPFKEDGV